MGQRVKRSVMNMKVGMLFYLLSLVLSFFSRKVFLDCLGAEFMGLTGVLQNILSYLNVAELGIGTSITYFLYKPIEQDDRRKIGEVMSVLACLWHEHTAARQHAPTMRRHDENRGDVISRCVWFFSRQTVRAT